MTVNKRKKNSRHHGSWTHGWGEKKKHRGAGHRGGRGNAGTGKRGDAKKPSINVATYFGKFGFKSKNTVEDVVINLGQVQEMLPQFVSKGYASKGKDGYTVNLTALGFTKILGFGKVNDKLNIIVKKASQTAMSKVAEAGGAIMATTETAEKTA